MFNRREWGDLHGEPPMSRRQFDEQEAVERAYRRQYFNLRLTPDELDWLFGVVMPTAANRMQKDNQLADAREVEDTIKAWASEAADQGYRA